MAWLKVHQEVFTHRKTLALAEALGCPDVQAAGHVISLWAWALDNAPTGDLGAISPRALAVACRWTRKPNVLHDALIHVGFLDAHDGWLTIHDWDDYGGALADKRARDAERQREVRRAQRVTSDGRPSDDPRDERVTYARKEQSRVEKPPVVPLGKGDGRPAAGRRRSDAAAAREAQRRADLEAKASLDRALASALYIDPIDPTLPPTGGSDA